MEKSSGFQLGTTPSPCLRSSNLGQKYKAGTQCDWEEGAADGEVLSCDGSPPGEADRADMSILSDQEGDGGGNEEAAPDCSEFILREQAAFQSTEARGISPRLALREQHRRFYECESCGRRFSDPSNLRRHRHIHTGRRPYPCETCGATFRQKSQLERHRFVHTGERPFQCAFCPKGFRDSTELRVHYRVHTGERPYNCAECQQTFSRICYLKRHREKHRSLPKPAPGSVPSPSAPTDPASGGFPCTFCSRTFESKKQLELHRRGLHLRTGPSGQRLYECGDCRKRFNNSSNLRKHAVIHTGAKPFRCTVCGQRFRQATHLERHYLIHTGERPFPCPDCGKGFRDTSDLLKHQRVHTGEKPYQCSVCQKRFKHLHNARVHHQRHSVASVPTAEEGTQGVEGTVSPVQAKAKDSPREINSAGTWHINATDTCSRQQRMDQTSSDEETCTTAIQMTEVQCTATTRSTTDGIPSSRVQGTDVTHETSPRSARENEEQPLPEPLECSFCRKAFARISGLRRHSLIHTGHRPFGCHLCGKTFRQLSHLERHKRIHTGERRYHCTTCQKAFRESSDLLRHQQIHTREKCFRCPLCLKTYTQLRYLKMHRLKHGLNQEDEEEEEEEE